MGKKIPFASLGRPLTEFAEIEFEVLVEDLLCHPTLTLLHAPSGGQKSLFALDMARSVASGGTFLGYQAKQTSVLYIDGEMSDASIGKRAKTMGIELPLERLNYMTPQDCELNFDDESCQEQFLEYIETTPYRFVVFDNLRVLLNVNNENDAACFYSFNAFAKRLRDLGCTVLVIHHSNKGGETYAGSSNLITVYDYVIGLSGESFEEYKKLTVSKVRDDTGLHSLNQQYVSFTPDGFVVNAYSEFDMELVVNRLVSSIERGETTTIRACQAFLREQGLTINNNGWNLETLFNNYIRPHYTGDEPISSLAAFKELLSKGRRNSPDPF